MLETTIKNARKVWFISDEHYGHKNIIKYCARGFKDEYEMRDAMVENHNNVVSPDDLVIHVGDFSAGIKGRKEWLKETFDSLNGTHILVRGNHDHLKNKAYIQMGFSAVYDYLEIGPYFICHYPLDLTVQEDWIKPAERELDSIFAKSKCNKLIHGHQHVDARGGWRFNVSADLNGFTPVDFDKIHELFENGDVQICNHPMAMNLY